MAPDSMLFRNYEEDQASEETNKKWQRWNPQDGYLDEVAPPVKIAGGEDIEEKLKDEQMPRRSIAPGRHSGLTLMLNVERDDYYCSGTESVGFKGLLHMPASYPELVEYGFAIRPGTENFMPIAAEVIYADNNIHDISYTKKACFMQDEKYLRYFKNYAFLNCMTECTSNYTYKVCNCVAYYMPRDQKSMDICPPSKAACIEEAIVAIETTGYDPNGPAGKCECLSACTEMKYPLKISSSRVNRGKGLHVGL